MRIQQRGGVAVVATLVIIASTLSARARGADWRRRRADRRRRRATTRRRLALGLGLIGERRGVDGARGEQGRGRVVVVVAAGGGRHGFAARARVRDRPHTPPLKRSRASRSALAACLLCSSLWGFGEIVGLLVKC